MKLLVLFSSCEGQTLKIAKHIVAQQEGEVVADFLAIDKQLQDVDLTAYDKVLIGASIRYGKFRPQLYSLLETYQSQLSTKPVAFFGVCLTARKPEKNTPETSVYMKKLNLNAAWVPKLQAVFAGALLYSKYTWWQTLLIQFIMKMTGGSTDKSQDLELTDWTKVDEFATQFSNLND
ncbi:menaquinone-dependent protoporphyrinogen IX dehydrogenase [Agarivorans aestuarii]|uniref:menaquinone-dependent protoporphyrinogen IX dehydrogenase n=1 Tax=Agarivorans aestuarii TaxID=1563703 RepID=UPI001C800E21|nr:menaquinone-dependent protoporphyrinogen IX dehydrogenase [Agarivorans aestuarii]